MSFEQNKVEYINFKLGDNLYGLPVQGVEDVMELVKLSKVPSQTSDFAGIFLKDSQVTVAMDLSWLYGQNSFDHNEKMVIVVKWNDGQYGLIVDSLLEIGVLNPESKLISLAEIFRKVELSREYDKTY